MFWSKSDGSEYDEHETNSKTRYNGWQRKLNEITKATDKDTLDFLVAKLDAQLKLEDFLVKFREADHPKLKVWGPIFLPVIVPAIISLIVTALTLLLHNMK